VGRQIWLFTASVGLGIGAWVLVSAISGEREAWDSPWYLFFNMPIVCAAAPGLSYTDARRPWRWGVLPMMAQVVWIFAIQGFGNLWPLGVGFFLVLALSPITTAYLGAFFGR